MKQSEFDFERAIKQFDKLFNEIERLNTKLALLQAQLSEHIGATDNEKRVVYTDTKQPN